MSVAANSSLLMIACMALSLPTMYVYLVPGTHNDLKMSYAAAVALAVSYIQFIFYQTSTHGHLFQDCGQARHCLNVVWCVVRNVKVFDKSN